MVDFTWDNIYFDRRIPVLFGLKDMEKASTKERLIAAATDLFSTKGYAGTSVDEIAAAVGIKGPTIYKYFKGKEDILNNILELANVEYVKGMKMRENAKIAVDSGEVLKQITLGELRFTLGNENIRKLRKLFTIEQYRNERFTAIANDRQMNGAKTRVAEIFRHMIDIGTMKPGDPDILALQFTAPTTILLQYCDREPDKKDEILKLIEAHIDQFIADHCI